MLSLFSFICLGAVSAAKPPALPEAKRVIQVDNTRQLNRAIDRARAGDRIVLASGDYDGLYLKRLKGSGDRPIGLVAAEARGARITGSVNGRNLRLSDCENLYFYGLRFTGAEIWSVTVGPAHPDDSLSEGCRRIRFDNCEFDHAGQALLKISGQSQEISVNDSDFHHSGIGEASGRPFAEGIYIGEGASNADRSSKIHITNNHFHDIGNARNWGEAIDVKRQCSDILIERNLIENVVVDSGGAITALFDPVDYPEDARNPNVVIRGNRIRDVRTHPGGWHAAGICIGANGISLIDNTVADSEGPGLLVLANAANTTGGVVLKANDWGAREPVVNRGSNASEPIAVVFAENSEEEGTNGDR